MLKKGGRLHQGHEIPHGPRGRFQRPPFAGIPRPTQRRLVYRVFFLLGFTGFYRVLLGFTGLNGISLGITGFYWVLLLFFSGFPQMLLALKENWLGCGPPSIADLMCSGATATNRSVLFPLTLEEPARRHRKWTVQWSSRWSRLLLRLVWFCASFFIIIFLGRLFRRVWSWCNLIFPGFT